MKRSDNLFEDIFHVARQVPHGRVTTYGAIAEYLQFGSPRIVGLAMHQSFMALPPVPAHRVVNRNGDLKGRNHFRTPTLMQELLESEGVKVENDRVTDFKMLVWYPADHLD